MYPDKGKRHERIKVLEFQIERLLDERRLLNRRLELLQHEKMIISNIDKLDDEYKECGQQKLSHEEFFN